MNKSLIYRLLIIFSIIAAFTCCLGSSNDLSSNYLNPESPYFQSLTFTANTLYPNQELAKFVLTKDDAGFLYKGDDPETHIDSVIVNLDSLPCGTRVDSVLANFSFQSVYAAYYRYADDTKEYQLTGNDTIDFTRVVLVHNISADNNHNSYYRVQVNVHRVEPNLYVWNNPLTFIIPPTLSSANQFALYFQTKPFYYNGNLLYNSNSDSYDSWIAAGSSGLPPTADFRNIKQFNGNLYLFNNGQIYSSPDGFTWSNVNFPESGYTPVNLIFTFQNTLYGIVTDGAKYYFAKTFDGASWIVENEIPDGFPIEKFEAVPNSGHPTQAQRALVYGGKTPTGTFASNSWVTEDCVNWHSFAPIIKYPLPNEGMSIVAYNNQLLMFGGATDSTYIQVSVDEGFSWSKADTTYLKLPANFQRRTYQSTFVDNNDRIVIIGGLDTLNNPLSDVWTLKMNGIDW